MQICKKLVREQYTGKHKFGRAQAQAEAEAEAMRCLG